MPAADRLVILPPSCQCQLVISVVFSDGPASDFGGAILVVLTTIFSGKVLMTASNLSAFARGS